MAPISIGHGAVQHSIEGIQGYINANYFAPPAYWSQEIWAINAYVIAQGLDGLEPEAFNWRPRFIRMVTFSRVEGFVTTSMRGNQPLKTFKVWSAFPIHCECAG
jgi:hypothetical protein